MALPRGTTGSLCPTFVSARLVCLAVRQAYAIALNERFPTALSLPSRASVTLWEATAPVKLPTMRGLGPCFEPQLDIRIAKGGISRTAPRKLAPPLQSLPPILHIAVLMPAQSCSKGARGLSV